MSDIDWVERSKQTKYSVFNFIGGKRAAIGGDGVIVKHAGRDGKKLYSFAEGRSSDVDYAVSAAKRAFDDGQWSHCSVHERAAVLRRLAELVEANNEEFALNESMDVGKPISSALQADVNVCVSTLREAAASASLISASTSMDGGCHSYQVRKPIGVVAAIVGWNFPLVLATQKIAPALMMGNCLVLKPSEFTSLSACRLAELASEAGVPDGVFNVVHGTGDVVGRRLAEHPDVRLLSFTGSSATGKKLMVSAGSSNMKRLILECGGKSPFLIFDDYDGDLDALAANIVAAGFPNQGALCVSSTRVLMQASIREKLLPLIIEKTEAISPGDPLDPNTSFGAIMNEAHMNKVLGYVQSGREDGAQLLCGGEQVRHETGGYYLTPALFDNVGADSRIAKEETFGPLVTLFSFDTEEEALSLANDSQYGLAAYAVTSNARRLQRLARGLDAGLVELFTTMEPAPGGVHFGIEPQKQSGFGSEGGLNGLIAYSQASMVMAYS